MGAAPTTTAAVLALPEHITFNCTYLGTQVVNFYVIDEANNWDYCETYVDVQDNMGACEGVGTGASMALVTGTIKDWKENTVEEVMVRTATSEMMTKTDGFYNFELAMNNSYTIEPSKDDRPLNGVSTFDLVVISKHILGIQGMENPYQLIAADVNSSGTITAFDMVQIRQLILNIKTEFTNSPSWKFVDASYDFSTTDPISAAYPEVKEIGNLSDDMEVDFVAIKMGDVNGSARPNSLMQGEDRTTRTTFEIVTEDRVVKAGETYTVEFTTNQLPTIQGYQFTLTYEALQVLKLKSGVVGIENFGVHKMDKGMITTSWNASVSSIQSAVGSSSQNANQVYPDASGQQATGNRQLFTIEFIAEKDGKLSELLSLSNRPTVIEAYAENGELMEVALTFTTPLSTDKFELFQNQPNPFQDRTMIGFYLPEDSEVQLILRDETGRVLRTIKEERQAGYNTIQLEEAQLTNGFIYYQLSTKFGTKAKKMLQLK